MFKCRAEQSANTDPWVKLAFYSIGWNPASKKALHTKENLAIEIVGLVRDKNVDAVGISEVFNLRAPMDNAREAIMQHIVAELNSSAARPAWTGRSDGHYIFLWSSNKLLLQKYDYISCGVTKDPWRMAQYFQFHRAEIQYDSPLHVCHNHSPSSGRSKMTEERRQIIFATLWNYVLQQQPGASPRPVAIFGGDFNCAKLQWTRCLQRANFTEASRQYVQMCTSKENPLHGDEALVFNAYAAQQNSGWGKSFPRANQPKPFSDGHDVVLVPICWDHLHSPSSAALPAPPSVNPLAASDKLSSAVLPAVQSMTPLTVKPAAPEESAAPAKPGYFCEVCSRSWLLKDTPNIAGGLCCGRSVVETDILEVTIDGCGYSKPGCPVIRPA